MNKKCFWVFVFVLFLTACGTPPKEHIAEQTESSFVEKSESSLPAPIFVYVCGAVNAPGVFELPEGARVADAIAAAGGLSANADSRLLNQARRLSDGEQITVLTANEAEALLGDDPVQRAKKLLGQDSEAGDGKVNLNLADEAALQTLPGIGETKARAITEYRKTHGAFGAIEDVCNVPGIKGSVFEKIKDRITV